MPILNVKFRFFFIHIFIIYFFGYTRYATSYWKDVKGPVQFREKLRPGEALEWAWFGDIRLIGMYFLGDSSHMYKPWKCMSYKRAFSGLAESYFLEA